LYHLLFNNKNCTYLYKIYKYIKFVKNKCKEENEVSIIN
jgi:hypothetical protein